MPVNCLHITRVSYHFNGTSVTDRATVAAIDELAALVKVPLSDDKAQQLQDVASTIVEKFSTSGVASFQAEKKEVGC